MGNLKRLFIRLTIFATWGLLFTPTPSASIDFVALCLSGQLRGAEARLEALRDAQAALSFLGTVRTFASEEE